jgi:hypothetical protein
VSVAGQQSRAQAVCEGDIRRVVRGQVGAELPDPLEQRLMRMAHDRELNQILERTLRSRGGELGRPNKTAKNRHRLDDRQVRKVGIELMVAKFAPNDAAHRCANQVLDYRGRIEDDQRASLSSLRMSAAAVPISTRPRASIR